MSGESSAQGYLRGAQTGGQGAQTVGLPNWYSTKADLQKVYEESWTINTAIVLASRSFSWNSENRLALNNNRCLNSINHIIIFKDIIDILNAREDCPKVEAFAQEPLYNDLDKAFLAFLNITIIGIESQGLLTSQFNSDVGPQAKEKITPQTLYYSPLMWFAEPFAVDEPEMYIGGMGEERIEEFKWSDAYMRGKGWDPMNLSDETQKRKDEDAHISDRLRKFKDARKEELLLGRQHSFASYFGINSQCCYSTVDVYVFYKE
ncbi:hypothetical protein EJ08DRAFT_702230 [Tothia fuscella]|uniref:SRR1-like domain-containing protein n=1 Tax=Tothia fuscella TaxID=1048955 RepID=A0A9P4NGR0_9PEZI|nr:hypothetical protein EJ08DRAFT_702230 [Tothia fuscella]